MNRPISAFCLALPLLLAASNTPLRAIEPAEIEGFHKEIRPILTQFCTGCHDSELKKGGIAFDQDESVLLSNRELWWKA